MEINKGVCIAVVYFILTFVDIFTFDCINTFDKQSTFALFKHVTEERVGYNRLHVFL